MEQHTIKSNHKGDFNVSFPSRTRLTIRTTHAFTVETSKGDGQELSIIAPNSDLDRYSQTEHDAGTTVHVTTSGKTTAITVPLASRDEHPSPDSLCEVVQEEKLSMYDRLKAEMFQALSVYAEDKGLDTFEDDDDHTFEEDENLIATPYEYTAMIDDIPNIPTEEPQAPAETNTSTEPTTPPTEEPQTAS